METTDSITGKMTADEMMRYIVARHAEKNLPESEFRRLDEIYCAKRKAENS